jgi:hypothetical protein
MGDYLIIEYVISNLIPVLLVAPFNTTLLKVALLKAVAR